MVGSAYAGGLACLHSRYSLLASGGQLFSCLKRTTCALQADSLLLAPSRPVCCSLPSRQSTRFKRAARCSLQVISLPVSKHTAVCLLVSSRQPKPLDSNGHSEHFNLARTIEARQPSAGRPARKTFPAPPDSSYGITRKGASYTRARERGEGAREREEGSD